MAKITRNYGTKKQVYSETDFVKKPLFVLGSRDMTKQTDDYWSEYVSNAKKCYCSECQNLFDIDVDCVVDKNYKDNVKFTSNDANKALNDIECPNCKNHSGYVFVQQNGERKGKEGHINMSGTWVIPPMIKGRYVFTYKDENGKPTRIDDNVIFEHATVFPSGKKFTHKSEFSETTDLLKNRIIATETKIIGNNREQISVADSVDKYQYLKNTDESYNSHQKFAIRHSSDAVGVIAPRMCLVPTYLAKNDILSKKNPLSWIGMGDEIVIISYDSDADRMRAKIYDRAEPTIIDESSKAASAIKMRTLEKRFNVSHPVYTDTKNNGLFLAEHHPGSNEDNTPIDYGLMSKYYTMMTKYPVAFEYACERADGRILNHEFAEKRKAEADANYTPRQIADSARAKILREETHYVAEQLASVDDKILATIGKSKNVEDMKQQLQFFVFGDNDKITDTKVPSGLSAKNGQTIQDPLQATKALKKEFKANPIGTANTVYTCHKIGIKDTNFVNKMLEVAHNSPDVHPKSIKKGSKRYLRPPKIAWATNADTICPINGKDSMRFLRNYANSHNHGAVIDDIYGSEEKFDRYIETLRIYTTVTPYAKIADKPDEIQANQHEIEKAQVRSYLMNKTIQEAYVDFIEKYREKTPEIINGFAKEIAEDKRKDDIKAFYDTNGLDATMERYGSDLADIKDPKAYLDAYKPFSETECVLATRNGKSLFHGRNIDEIHDELSHMSKNVVCKNTPIDYSDEERAFEAEYDAPDGSGKWSFHLHKDTFEMIRTATELSNCLASHTDRALHKSETLLYMKNELGEKVACISLNKNRWCDGEWKVDEFQAAHDNAVDGRYKDVCLQWLDEHEINYSGNSNVAAIGTNKSFYGGHDIDYHNEEIDEVTNTVVDKHTKENRNKIRESIAREIYKETAEGRINVPTAPDFGF